GDTYRRRWIPQCGRAAALLALSYPALRRGRQGEETSKPMARTHEPRRPPTRAARVPKQPRSSYLITGLALGGLWLLNRDKSLLYHAVQMTALMSVLTAVQIVLGQVVLRR